jgi:hypothetical protein
MMELFVIEDGREYEEFARLFLGDCCAIRVAHSAREALDMLGQRKADRFLVDLRFDRAPESALAGDVEETARRLFAGDRDMAVQYLKENQGTLALAEIRKAGHEGKAIFVHDFPEEQLENLRRLYGEVVAVPFFDAVRLRRELEADR